MTKVISIRLGDDISRKLDALSVSVDRPRSWLIEQALKNYLHEHSWQVMVIREALEEYHTGKAEFKPHEEVIGHLEAKIKAKTSS